MRRAPLLLALAAAAWLAAAPARALNPEEQLADPRLEARARTISRELRCVVCQSETVDESSAPVAEALRKLVRDRLVAGDTDRQAIAAVTARYGEFVLLKPRFEPATAILWLGPFAALAAALALALAYLRRQSGRAPETAALSPEEARELARLSGEGEAG